MAACFASLIAGALTILFAGLKLGGVTDWSWWVVPVPVFAVAGAGVVLALAVIGVAALGFVLGRQS